MSLLSAMIMDNLLRVFALASVAPSAAENTAALYGAAAPATLLPRYRRGWEYCTANLCGGAERLGALLDVGDLRELGPEGADKINDAVRAYGVVVIKNQNLTRAEQVKFTGLLGEPVALAKSFYGKRPGAESAVDLARHEFLGEWHVEGHEPVNSNLLAPGRPVRDAPPPATTCCRCRVHAIATSAIASRRWRGGRHDDSGRGISKILIFTQAESQHAVDRQVPRAGRRALWICGPRARRSPRRC